jgi:hypothetical protein
MIVAGLSGCCVAGGYLLDHIGQNLGKFDDFKMPSVASDVYARHLLPEGHGYPLWIPEPNDFLPEEYKALGTRIGDVGLLTTDGAFDYLFNVCRPADHPINLGRTPSNFEYVDVREAHDMCATRGLHSSRSHVASATMKRKTIGAGSPPVDSGYVYFLHVLLRRN